MILLSGTCPQSDPVTRPLDYTRPTSRPTCTPKHMSSTIPGASNNLGPSFLSAPPSVSLLLSLVLSTRLRMLLEPDLPRRLLAGVVAVERERERAMMGQKPDAGRRSRLALARRLGYRTAVVGESFLRGWRSCLVVLK
jgi:hypothetical protein